MALPKGLGQHKGNQSQCQLDAEHPIPEINQSIPVAPGPLPLERYAPQVAIPVRAIPLFQTSTLPVHIH